MIDREALKAKLTDEVLAEAFSVYYVGPSAMRDVLLDALLAPEAQDEHVVEAKPQETWLGDRRIALDVRQLRAVGSTPTDRLLWLGAFAKRPIADDAGRIVAAKELDMLLLHHLQGWGVNVNTAVDHDLQQFVAPAAVAPIQAAIGAVLDDLQPGRITWLPQAIGEGLAWHSDRVSIATRSVGVAQVLAAVADLLMTIGRPLRRCQTPTCRRLFGAKRPAQVHCTTACGTAYRVAKWRREHPKELAEIRHQRYARRVQARLPGARVRRRDAKKG